MLPPHRPVAATRPARAHTAHNIPQIYEEIPRNETKGPDLPRNRRAAERPRGDFPAFFLESAENFLLLPAHEGGLAQLARALAWHARGHEFESRILHDASGQAVSIRGQPVLHTKARHSRTAGRLSPRSVATFPFRAGESGLSQRRNPPCGNERNAIRRAALPGYPPAGIRQRTTNG